MRAQRALLAIACGQGERGRDTVKALVEQAATLGIERQKEAAAAMAPHVAAAEARPEFAIGPDVSRAFADFLDFMRNRDTGKKWGTVEEYLKQGDMLDPRSKIAESILRMLGERKSPGYVAEVARVYAEAAKGEQDGLFGAARKPAEIWREAEKAVAEDGGKRWSVVTIGGQDVALITNLADAAKISPKDPSSIEDYIRRHLEEHVEMLAGGTASITEKSARHYAWSVVRGVDGRQMRRARAKAATVIGDLIRMFTADNSTYENKPGKEGVAWRNRLPFGIPRTDQSGKVIGGTVYDADVIVKDEGHGKFFYDVSHLKKNEALTRQLDNQAEALVRANSTAITPKEAGSASGASVGSIAQSGAGGNGRRWSIGRLYTGSAADYEKPSLLKVGTGEGSQVYGWGLYASSNRNVAEGYSTLGNTFKILKDGKEVSIREDDAAWHIGRFANGGSVNKAKVDARARIKAGDDPEFYKKVLKDISAHKYEIARGTQNVYEQTFFTNRAPGDESHLLKWYEPVSEENLNRIVNRLNEENVSDLGEEGIWRVKDGKFGLVNSISEWTATSGEDVYKNLRELFGRSEQKTSEFLARADIDGIKYPVDSYGKTVKDGDKAGWNYVSFRDDNIRVDHKWVDGQQRWSIATRLDEERQLIEERGGQLLLAHHGTDSRGFTRFEKSDDIGYFFAKSRNTAASYIRKGRRGDDEKPGIPNYEDVMTFLNDEASGYTPEEVAAMSYEEKIQAYTEGTLENSGVYDVALKMEDPYEIDCHGAAWNAIYEIPDDTRSDTTTYDRVILDYNSITGKFGFWRREYIEDRNDWVPGKEAGVDKAEFDDFESFRNHVIQEMGDTFAMDELEEIKRKAENDEDVSYEPVNGSQEKSEAGMMWAFDSVSGEGWGVFPRKTREIVEDAANMGCDGVIFHNVVDNGGGIKEADADDVYVVMKPEQVKSVDSMTYADDGSIIPAEKRLDWSNRDIRWSVAGQAGAAKLGIDGQDAAEKMETDGADREDIWRKTGWWRGKDGKWRVEVDPPYLADRSKFEFLKGGELVRLGELFPDSPVISAYGLERIPVTTDHAGERQVLNGATAAYGFKINGEEGIVLRPSLVEHISTKPSAGQLHMLENFSPEYAKYSREWSRIFNEYDSIGPEEAEKRENEAKAALDATDAGKIYEDIRSEKGERFIPSERFLSVMTHEIQHIIQDREGFAQGGNPGLYDKGRATAEIDDRIASLNAELDKVVASGEDREAFDRLRKEIKNAEDEKLKLQKDARDKAILRYHHLSGEVEARNVEKRLTMTIEKRLATPPWETEDVKDDNQTVRWSVGALPDGRQFVDVDNVPVELADEKDLKKKRNIAVKLIRERWVGKIIDEDGVRAFVNVVTAKEYASPAKKLPDEILGDKLDAASELDKIVATSTNPRIEDDGRDGHKHDGVKAWEYRDVLLKVGDRFYSGKVNIKILEKKNANGENQRLLHDVTGINDITDGVRQLYDTRPRKVSHIGESVSSIAQSTADGNAAEDPFFALGNQKRRREAERRDPEAVARQAIVALTQGGEEDKTSALVAFVAYRDLTGGAKPRAKTISTLGFQMGMKTVAVGKIVREGEGLAKRMRDTVIAEACERGDVATAMAMLARERMADAAAERIVSGAAQRGGYLKEKGEIAQKAIMEREISKLVRATNAATLEDMERDTGLDLASEILAADPDKFDPSKAQKKVEELTDLQKARRKERQAAAEKRVAEMIEKAKARSEKKAANHKANADAAGRDLENQAAFDAENGGEGGGGAAAGAAEAEKPDLKTFADFKTKEEFAAFLRAWATDAFAKSIGIRELTKAGKHRLFAEFYRKTVIRELSDLADKLLPPKGARAWANRRLGEIEQGTAPDTIERISGDVFALINRNAIREERTALIQKFRNDVRRYYNGEEFDEFKQDTDRKLTGWIEESARYIHRVCNLAIRSINGEPSQIEQEREKLREIIDKRSEIHDESGKKTVDWAITDDKARRALAKLELLDRFGGMRELMPGEIADRTAEALEYLEKKAGELEKSWEETRRVTDGLIRDFAGGVIGPKGGMRYERGKGVGAWFDGLADALNGMIRLRLQHLTRFADPKAKEVADRAINSFVTMLGDGEVAYSRITDRDRKAFAKALHEIFRGDNARIEEWMNRMTENIPVELSRQISNQEFAEGMTYGQMFQLLVSIEQGSLRPNVEANGRDGQSRLIRDWIIDNPDGTRTRMFTSEDALFVDWLREFYKSTRAEASKVTERMNGMPIYSPDPLYCPVKMWTGDVKRDWHGDTGRWDPVGSVFARRVENLRDFDESASVLGMFFDRSAARAQLIAWAERGTILRNVFTDVGVRNAIERAFGKGEYSRIAKQIEQTMTGGQGAKKTPGEIAAADKAMNYITYASLGFNPLSAMKQTTSFPVWANAIGWTRLWHHMTHFDKAALKHIMESEAFKVRYGDQVNGGMDIATRGLNENPGRSRSAQIFQKWSMGLLKLGDFAPGGWIAQGVYKDFLDKHLKEGMEFDAADRLSLTETFNLLEETQQSGRTYNTNELSREHGRIGRLLTQFATSPLQQLQYETQAFREVRDLWKYRPAAKDAAWEKNFADAKAKLVRAVVINHVLLPAALHSVTNIYKLAMGYDPEWEQDGWHQTLLRDLLLGQFSRVFYIGTMAQTTFDALVMRKNTMNLSLLPSESAITQAANIAITARDVFMGMDPEKMRKDIDRLLKSTSVTRTPYDLIWRATGRDMNQRKVFIKKGRMPK